MDVSVIYVWCSKSGLLETLHGLLSMKDVAADVQQMWSLYDDDWNAPVPDEAAPAWNPWPPHMVRMALCTGQLSKWELVLHMGETPDFLIPREWFEVRCQYRSHV